LNRARMSIPLSSQSLLLTATASHDPPYPLFSSQEFCLCEVVFKF
jgi:hypothetical protein